MEFKDTQAIYLQIADYICEQVLLSKWQTEERLPSVRELAVLLEVNPNTVMRTCELLQQQEIIYNKRGIGYFISADAVKKIKQYKKEAFITNELPSFFRSMYLLDLDLDELKPHFEKFKKSNFN
ncbi:GntR family transcriptional regulator [Chitinophaga polysaccharea]|uniref:GntR family transcriptional regulator n=1 Tax=Chitinophaga TaxID=79328 RepID=UPI0014553616|nr:MULTISPECIES: GntR family transcriptional regulator [Chitinophaga]NLR61756.1 GntR family transcriptional regulator [Chitinophaga polysaccharea]NLU92614.1 GntR family transcriptional regulator [Chitinophaga sp. Ak27]